MGPILAERRELYAAALERAPAMAVSRLETLPEVEKTIAFASYPPGSRDLFTNLDLLVVIRTPEPLLKRMQRLYELLPGTEADLDLVAHAPEEVEEDRSRPFFGASSREGRSSMRSVGEGTRWLEQAKEDLRWTRVLLEQGGYRVVAFLAQEVAEKSLKAALYHLGQEAVLRHSVERLAADVAVRFPEARASAPRGATWDAHHVTSRYPNSVPGTIRAGLRPRDRGRWAADRRTGSRVCGEGERGTVSADRGEGTWLAGQPVVCRRGW